MHTTIKGMMRCGTQASIVSLVIVQNTGVEHGVTRAVNSKNCPRFVVVVVVVVVAAAVVVVAAAAAAAVTRAFTFQFSFFVPPPRTEQISTRP